MKGNKDKIRLIYGSFYDLQDRSEMYDVIVMSQAFHHSDQPLMLLTECDSVLREGGAILLTGEHVITLYQYVRRIASTIIKKRKMDFDFYSLFPPDDVSGDHYYRSSDYQLFFSSLGYKLKEIHRSSTSVFVAIK